MVAGSEQSRRLLLSPGNRDSGGLEAPATLIGHGTDRDSLANAARMMRTESARPTRLPTAPLAPVALAMGIGITVDRYLASGTTLFWVTAALAAAAVAALCGRGATGVAYAAILTAWLAVGGGWHHARWSDLAPEDVARRVSETPQPAWLRGVLLEVPAFRPGSGRNEAGSTRTVLAVSALSDGRSWQKAGGQVLLVVAGDRTELSAGALVSAVGQLGAVPGALNPGEFDYRDYLRAQGIRARLVAADSQSVWLDSDAASPLGGWQVVLTRSMGSARAWSQAHLVGGLDPRIAPLAAALLLGRREAVDPDVNDAFARTGTMHLLAISGLHLQVLAAALWFLLRLAGLPRRRSFLIVSLVMVGYALLVGLAPSVVRSAAMTLMICVGSMRDRTTRPANVLALAAIATMLLNPAHVFDVGCQLSFLAVAAIAWGTKPMASWLERPLSPLDRLERRYQPWWRTQLRRWQATLAEGVLISCVVWVVTLPLVSLRFHLLSPIGILLNIPLIPITSLALVAAGVTLLASALWAPLGAPAAWACAWLLGLTEHLVRWGSAQSWGHLFVPGPAWWWVAVFYFGLTLAALAAYGRWPGRRWGWAALGGWVVLGLVLAAQPHRPAALEADVLAVGHGLAVVVQAPDGHALLYDCGRMGDPQIGRRVIAPALWSRGVHRIYAVVLSHADADHYNALPDLLERFSIGAVCVAPGFASARNPGALRLLGQVRDRGVPIRTLAAGEQIPFGRGIGLSILHPPRGWRPDASDNDHSLVLDISSGGRHTLLLGDLEQVGLMRLVAAAGRRADALVAPHHGGRTANPPLLYDWAEPACVIVSQRRPASSAREPLAFLADRGVPVLRTWQSGAVALRWARSGLAVRGFRDRPDTEKPSRAMMAHAVAGLSWLHVLLALAAFLLGLGLCFALAAIEWGAWILVRPGRRLRPVEHPPGPWEFIEARAGDGTRLVGLWHSGSPKDGRTAIVLHGFAEDRSAVLDRAESLAERGWNVALPDARGHGQSEGDHASFGGREASDLCAWLDVLEARVGSRLHFAVWGRSMGAAVALRAAGDDRRISSLVLEAPYPDLELAVAGWLARLRVPRRLARPIIQRAAALAGVSLHQPRPIDLAPGVHVPTLILHGTDDPIVRLTDVQQLAQAFPVPPELIDVPGARHVDVIEAGGAELLVRIVGFLEQRWPKSASPGRGDAESTA